MSAERKKALQFVIKHPEGYIECWKVVVGVCTDAYKINIKHIFVLVKCHLSNEMSCMAPAESMHTDGWELRYSAIAKECCLSIIILE